MPPPSVHRKRLYAAHVVNGLDGVAASEIIDGIEGARVVKTLKQIDDRTDLILFQAGGSPGDLLKLRTIEDVFAVAAETGGIPAGRAGLPAITATITQSKELAGAVATALEVRPRHKGRTTFRVIARKSGDHAFRRVDVQRAVERGLQSRFAAWRLVEDDAHLEIWVQLVGAWLVVTVRLSDAGMRHRHWRQTSLPASLKPTLAAAMCLLSHPQDGDVFLDPMCGSGTILIERAMLARYRLLLGGDADAQAVRATMDNIGRKHRPIEIRRWDARELPLESGSISVVVCNLPFGKQLGSATENRSLYPALIKEWRRVLAPTGRMVLLTSERALLRRAMEPEPTLAEERAIGVTVRGMKAWVIVQVSN